MKTLENTNTKITQFFMRVYKINNYFIKNKIIKKDFWSTVYSTYIYKKAKGFLFFKKNTQP